MTDDLTLAGFLDDAGAGPPDDTVTADAMDRLFRMAALSALPASPGGPALPHALLFRGANLGFSVPQAATVLADHPSLVFLGRLWDARRVDGEVIGGPRVPPAIWDLAGRDDERGEAHARLLERTGLRLPRSADADLELHLILWSASSLVRAAAGNDGTALSNEVSCHGGPFSVEVSQTSADRLRLRLVATLPGHCTITLHWPDGDTRTVHIDCARPCTFETGLAATELPSSVRLIRRNHDVA